MSFKNPRQIIFLQKITITLPWAWKSTSVILLIDSVSIYIGDVSQDIGHINIIIGDVSHRPIGLIIRTILSTLPLQLPMPDCLTLNPK